MRIIRIAIIALKIFGGLFCAALLIFALYYGISSIVTFHKAINQPIVVDGTEIHHFIGYYITAAADAVIFIFVALASAALAALIFLRKNKA